MHATFCSGTYFVWMLIFIWVEITWIKQMTAYKTMYLKSKWNWNQLKTNKCCKNDSPSSHQTWFGIAKTSELLLNFCSYPFINWIYNFIPFLYEMKSVFVCVFKESFLFEFNDISKGKQKTNKNRCPNFVSCFCFNSFANAHPKVWVRLN